MPKLFYGSFEKILRANMTPEITQKDLANILLLSPNISSEMDDKEREGAKDSIPVIDDARISKFCGGARKMPQSIIDDHLKPDAFRNVEHCFLVEIVSRIPIRKRESLAANVTALIHDDAEISPEEKRYYSEIATAKSLAAFLTEVYMLAVTGISMVMKANGRPKTLNLPEQNRFFCGREKLLEEIEARYRSGTRLQGIYGMGGVGKTQAALRYAHSHLDEYRIIWWLNAENELTLQGGASDFLRTQGYVREGQDTERIKEIFTGYFAEHSHWLLIYDNAEYGTPDEYDILAGYFPPGDIKGDILLTTRCNYAFEDGFHMELSVFEEEEAVSLLRKRTGIEDALSAATLARQMGYLPLALEYASAYIRETPSVDYMAYSRKLERFGIKVLDRRVGRQMYKKTVREAFHITLDKLLMDSSENNISKGAWQFLNICAFLAPDGIDLRIFSRYADGLPQPVRSVLEHELDRDEFIRVLTRYSLLRPERGTLSIHRLLQEVLRDELQSTEATLCINFAYGVFYGLFYSMREMSIHEIRPLLFPSVPHVQAILSRYVQYYKDGESEIPDYIMAAKEYFSWTAIILTDWKGLEEPDQAEGCQRDVPILQAAISFYDMLAGNKTIYYAYTLMLLAQSNKRLGNIEASSGQYLKALQAADRVVSELPVNTNLYVFDKVSYLYRAEAFQLASDICAAVGSSDLIYSDAELLWTNHRSLIKILLRQFACFPHKADASNYQETWLNLMIFSQQIANHTGLTFVLRLGAPKKWINERQHPFLDGAYRLFFPEKRTEYKVTESVIDGFDLMLNTIENRITEQADEKWTTLAFDEYMKTPEEMLSALLWLDMEPLKPPLRRSLYGIIFLLAEKLGRTVLSVRYKDLLLSSLGW